MANGNTPNEHNARRGRNPPALSESIDAGGCYPGGPRGEGAEHKRDLGARPIRGVTDVERRRAASRIGWTSRGRRWKTIQVVLVASAIALSTGAFVGFQAHESAEELAGERSERQREPDLDKEAARLLSELWKMEDLDRLRTP